MKRNVTVNISANWAFIVCFNTVFSLMFAFDFMKGVPGALGIIFGIASFIFMYVKLDEFLLKTKRKAWRKALLLSAVTMGVISLYPLIPMISGAAALEITGSIFNLPSSGSLHTNFIHIFSTTIFAGLILSTVVFIFTLLLRVLFYIKPNLVKTGDGND